MHRGVGMRHPSMGHALTAWKSSQKHLGKGLQCRIYQPRKSGL